MNKTNPLSRCVRAIVRFLKENFQHRVGPLNSAPPRSPIALVQSELKDAVAYEFDLLEYLRTTLFRQNEGAEGGIIMTLGEITPAGLQRYVAPSRMVTKD